eukprot:6164791-Amphidinium_carterae.1
MPCANGISEARHKCQSRPGSLFFPSLRPHLSSRGSRSTPASSWPKRSTTRADSLSCSKVTLPLPERWQQYPWANSAPSISLEVLRPLERECIGGEGQRGQDL